MAKLGTHHGGAWKVAYADFVTAMMALFMVLWLTAQPQETLEQMAEYFQDPYNTPLDKSMGVLKNMGVVDGKGKTGKDTEGQRRGKADMADIKVLRSMAQAFMKLLNVDNTNPERPIDLDLTSDGLRVTLYNRDSQAFFIKNTSEYTEWGEFVIETMSWLVQRHEFKVRVDGYVADGFEDQGADYSVWELSSDRASMTRRLMERYGVLRQQFQGVSAFGATQPLPFLSPTDQANDRVSISLVLTEAFDKARFDDDFDSIVK